MQYASLAQEGWTPRIPFHVTFNRLCQRQFTRESGKSKIIYIHHILTNVMALRWPNLQRTVDFFFQKRRPTCLEDS